MDLSFGERSVLMHTADAIYKSEMSRDSLNCGYDIRRTADGFEIAHISDEQINTFSGRREQIDDVLKARGLTRAQSTAVERTGANLATREGKHQPPGHDQHWSWREEARQAGINLEHPRERREPARDLSDEAVKSAVRDISERDTVFSRNTVRLEALKAGVGNTDLPGVERELRAGAGGLLDAGNGKLTTHDALTREQHLLLRARDGQGQVAPLMTDEQARAYIAVREATQGFKYSTGQRAALVLGLTTADRIVGVVGAAGAGKTTSMRSMVEAYLGAGHEVIGIAPSARARNELESAGAAVNRTVASFLMRQHDHDPHRLVVVDEAGMVSSADMDRLLAKLDQEGGRVLLVGDPRQLRGVEAGSPFQQMLETHTIQHARIDEIQRQRDPHLREIAQQFAHGDAGKAVDLARPYMRQVDVPAANPGKPTAQERRAAIAAETARLYLGLSPDERLDTLVISGTNKVRRQVNASIRTGLQAAGEVSREEITVRALDKADMTREKATHAESYTHGMVVRHDEGRGRDRHQVDYVVERAEGARVMLRGGDGQEKVWNPAKDKAAGVYQPRDLNLAAGDQIIFRENSGRGDSRVVNGQTATIERAGRDGIEARLDDGRNITLDPAKGHAIDHGWCRTVHSSQGATVDRVIVAGEASRVATAETAYVACSRERESLTIVTDHAERLAATWGRWAERQHAMTASHEHSIPVAEALKELRAEAAAELGKHGDLTRARETARDRDAPATSPARSGRGDDLELSR
jgi:hypothetical protein